MNSNGILDVFGHSWRIIAGYFVFWWEHREEGNEAAKEESCLHLVAALLPKKSQKKNKQTKKREEEMGGRKSKAIYINNDVLVSWKMKCMCLYSKDMAFARYPWRCDEERVKNPISVLDFL